jgi:CubicO group peptidase (beta-lactamase class C family)
MTSQSILSDHCTGGLRRRTAALSVALGALLAALLALGGAAQAQPLDAQAQARPRAATLQERYADTIRDGRTTARQFLTQAPGSSLSLALVRDGRVIWRQGFGYADRAAQTAPGPDTMYGIASVSKILATVATMQLVDQGKIDLDAPITRYIPTFTMTSPAYQEITVRMLLDHSSGFPGSDYGNNDTTVHNTGYLAQMQATLALCRLKTTPGYMSVYCNDGFTLVEAIVANVTGRSYAEYVQGAILDPLGMAHTAYPLSTFADGSYAKAYDGDTVKARECANSLASGGAYSTPSDLGKLGTMLMNGGVYRGVRILSAGSVAEMGTDQTLRSFNPVKSAALNFGLGWDTVTEPASHAAGVTAWAKNGGVIDYHSSFMVSPRAKLSVAVLSTSPLETEACDAIARRVLVHALKDQGTIRRLPGPVAQTPPPVAHATDAQLAQMVGVYAKSDGLYRVDQSPADPQRLVMSALRDGVWTPVIPSVRLRADGRFHAKGSLAGFWSVKAAGRRYLAYSTPGDFSYYRSAFLYAQKLQPDDPMTAAWQARLGHQWLLVTAVPTASTLTMDGAPLLQVGEVPGAPGYATITTLDYSTQTVDASRSDMLGAMFLQIPAVGSRDMEDAMIEQHGSDQWVRWGSELFRPKETVPALSDGTNTVSFGAEGYAEWRTVTKSTGLRVESGSAWFLYDTDGGYLSSGRSLPADVIAPAGSLLLLYGPAGGSVTVQQAAG